MSTQSHKSTSWFARFHKALQPRRRKASPAKSRRGLRFESLETRSLLSATVLPTISGIAYQDLAGGAMTAADPHVSNATVNLFRDGGDGTFEGKYAAADDTLVATATTDANGAYSFTNLNAGTYFVQEVGVPGLVVPAGTGVQKVVITDAELQGAPARTIDSFASTSQYVSGSLHGGKTGTSAVATADAIGGHRNLYVQLTSSRGSVSLGANSDFPGLLDFASGAASNGIFWVNWDGGNSNPAILNPTGLGQLDITSQGAATGISLSLGADHDNGYVMLKVYSDAGNWSWATVPLENTDDGSLGASTFVAFSDFSIGGGSGANFNKVGAIQLSVSGANANDGQVGPIQTVGPMVITQNLPNVPQVDLSVVKTAQPNPATAGNQLTYTFTTANNGPASATGVTLTDALPAGVTYVSSSASQGTVANNNGTLTVLLGSLAAGATASTTVVVSVSPGTSGSITNTVTVAGNQADPNLGNNTSSVTTQIVGSADLSLLKTVSTAQVKPGDPLSYTLTATNLGPSNATGVTIVDTLPPGFTYSTASGQSSVTVSGQTLTLNIGNLSSGATATITIGGTVTATAAGTLTNSATVSGAQADPNLGNNTSTASTQVSIPVVPQVTTDLSIVKTATPNPVNVGGTLTYTLVVSNNSLTTATGVKIVDTLPVGFTYVAAHGQVSATVVGGRWLTLNLGTLAAQATDTITIVGTVTSAAAASITNSAVVSADQQDTNTADNTSAVITTVVRAGLPSKYWFIV
jgi:large repetitive protein